MKKVKSIVIDPSVIIGHIDNGWVIEYPGYDSPSVQNCVKYDGDDMDYKLEKCKAIRSLLWLVMEGLGYYTSKHDNYNVRIKIEKEDGSYIDD